MAKCLNCFFYLVTPERTRCPPCSCSPRGCQSSVVSHARLQTSLEPVICRLSVRSPVSPWCRVSSTLRLFKSVSSPSLELPVPKSLGACSIFSPLAAAYPLPSVSLGGRHLIGGVPASFVLSSKSGGTLSTLFMKPPYVGAVIGENTRESADPHIIQCVIF